MADSSSFSPYELFAPNFNDRFGFTVAPEPQQGPRPYPKKPMDPNDPNYDPKLDPHNSQYDPNDQRLIGGLAHADTGAPGPTRPASQQPTIPIQTAQGAPQSPTQTLGNAPNSGMIGATPYSNQALTGGSGMPIGGLPTQSPMGDYSSPQQVNPQQMQQPPITGPASPQFRMQQQQMNMQKFAQLLGKLRAYNFLGQS